MRIITVFGTLGLLLLIAGTGWAQEPGEPLPPSGETARGAPPPTLHGELALSVQDAIAMSIENNLDVEIARFSPLIADLDHTSAWGVYDPNLFGSFDYSSAETPVATALQASNRTIERKTVGAAGVTGLIPRLGAQYEIAYGGQKLLSNSSIQSLSPEYRANLLGSLTLPLLKGAWWGEPWVAVKQTGIGSEIADEEFRRNLMDLTRATEDAYWSVSAAKEQRRVAQKSLEARQALLDQTEAQYEVGVVSRVEVIQAEAGLAEGEVGRDRRREPIPDHTGPAHRPRPRTQPHARLAAGDPADGFTRGGRHLCRGSRGGQPQGPRPSARDRQRPQKHRAAGDRAQVPKEPAPASGRPELHVRLQRPGRLQQPRPAARPGGDPLPPIDRSYSTAHDDWFRRESAKQWSGGVEVTFPIGNVSGRAGASKAHLELRRARTQVRRLELDIVLEVREAIRNLNSALEGIEAAERRRVAAEEQRRAEAIRLEYGESTPFDVLQREEVLVDAESQKINALQLYHNSVTALERSQGTILRNRNIAVEDAATLR